MSDTPMGYGLNPSSITCGESTMSMGGIQNCYDLLPNGGNPCETVGKWCYLEPGDDDNCYCYWNIYTTATIAGDGTWDVVIGGENHAGEHDCDFNSAPPNVKPTTLPSCYLDFLETCTFTAAHGSCTFYVYFEWMSITPEYLGSGDCENCWSESECA